VLGLIVERAIKHEELLAISRPLTESEYEFAASLNTIKTEERKGLIDMGDFIVLELLRMRRINQDDLVDIKAMFHAIDDKDEGYIDREKLKEHAMMMRERRHRDKTHKKT
jgi:Ca2+-binding EF-hand superfamily protein